MRHTYHLLCSTVPSCAADDNQVHMQQLSRMAPATESCMCVTACSAVVIKKAQQHCDGMSASVTCGL